MKLIDLFFLKISKLANSFIVLSNDMHHKISMLKFRKDGVVIIPVPVDERNFRARKPCLRIKNEMKIPNDSPVIMYVGGLKEIKGIHILIDAFAELIKKRPDAFLVLVGNSHRLFYSRKVNQKGIQDSVRLVGSVSFEKVAEYLSICNIFVLPSYTEGIPSVLLQAMAMEKPVVASTVGGIPDIVNSNENGILIKPGSIKALAEALLYLLENPDVATAYGRKASKKVVEKCSWVKILQSYEDLFEKLSKV